MTRYDKKTRTVLRMLRALLLLLTWIACALGGGCTGFSNEPSGASDRTIVAPGDLDQTPVMRPSDQAATSAETPADVRLVGAADFQPHRVFRQPALLLVPLSHRLPPGMPVFSLERSDGRWDFTRRLGAGTDAGVGTGNLPLTGWVDASGENAYVAAHSFSDHGPGVTEASPVLLTRIGEDNGVAFVCDPRIAGGGWLASDATLAGVRFSHRPFRTEAFRRAWSDVVLHSAGTAEEAQLVDEAVEWIERRFDVTASPQVRTIESPWRLDRLRGLWAEYRAYVRNNVGPGTWNSSVATATAARFQATLDHLSLPGDAEIARETVRELLGHAFAMGLADVRISNLRRVLLASPLVRDPAAVTGFDAAAQSVEQRQRDALDGNLRVLLSVGGRAGTTGDPVGLTALAAQGFRTVAQNLGRGSALMATLAQDLIEGNSREAEARATLCAHSNIQFYSAWANLDGAQHLARDRTEAVLASQELMARGAQAFLRGEASSMSQRAVYATLQYAWPTLRRGLELQQQYFANLEETSRTELRQLVAQRMATSEADPDAPPAATACATATSCRTCMDFGAACAWCADGRECLPSDASARGLTCRSGFVSSPAACSEAPAPVPPAATTDPCRRHANDCLRCTADVDARCGLCGGACRSATVDGTASADGVCRGVGWIRLPSACGPAQPAPLPRCPCWRGYTTVCRDVAARYAADHTCLIPAEILSGPNGLLRCGTEWSFASACANCVENSEGYADRCGVSTGAPSAGPLPAGWNELTVGSVASGQVTPDGQVRLAFRRVAGRRYRVVLIPSGDAAGTTDVDLYAGGASTLSLSSFECRPFAGGTAPEVCPFTAASDGWHYVLLHSQDGGVYTVSVFEEGTPAPSADVFDPPVNPPSGAGWSDYQPFMHMGNNHLGADLNRSGGASADLGSVVRSIADGEVVYAADAGPGWNGVAIVVHRAAAGTSFTLADGSTASTVWSLYGHLDLRYVSSWLSPGVVIRRGQPVGVVGPTPTGSTGPHLHLELRTEDLGPGDGYEPTPSGRVDPMVFIAGH